MRRVLTDVVVTPGNTTQADVLFPNGDYSFDITGTSPTSVGWQVNALEFTAAATGSAELKFTSTFNPSGSDAILRFSASVPGFGYTTYYLAPGPLLPLHPS